MGGADGPQYQGGDLTLISPLVTGQGGSVNRITAGGDIVVVAPEGVAPTVDAETEIGAELGLSGRSVRIDTSVVLPSGKLMVEADGDILIDGRAVLDLSGRSIEFFDDEEATQYSWGGDVILQSAGGYIVQAAGSRIDLSAEYNNAGTLTAVALAENAGRVALQGEILGNASGHYDAGGTLVPYRAGSVDIRAQSLGGDGTLTEQFATLNQRLNEGEVFGARSFQLKQGDLVIGEELRAGQINVSLDGGQLTVAGTIDASGERVGSIRLAGKDGLTIAGTAVLDTHSTVLRVDSYGKIIDSPNRAIVELSSGEGLLTLAEGARIDLRHGTDATAGAEAGQHDGVARGTLELNAPRLGGATSGDIAIDASGGITIEGARSIAVNAVQRYDDAAYGSDPAASGRPYQVIDQTYLRAVHGDNTAFIEAALQNSALLDGKLAGLNSAAYQDVFHLRPGVEIVSATPDGDLIVQGDLDLSEFRYASLNLNTPLTGVYGSGEVGALVIRAGGDLSIHGSINDGFAPPPETPDDGGWVLLPGKQPFGGDVLVPIAGVELAEGTVYPAGKTLNYGITVGNVTLPAGTRLPMELTLTAGVALPAGTVLAADVRAADGSVLLAAGTKVGTGGLDVPAGATLGVGVTLPVAVSLSQLTWPAGVALPVQMVQRGTVRLPVGAIIPSGVDVKLAEGTIQVPLRPADADGRQAWNWALAQMLPEGSQSWSMRFVAGADTDAADSRQIRYGTNHGVRLADAHYTVTNEYETVAGTILVWAPGNLLGYPAGTPVSEAELIYCELIPGMCMEQAPQPTYVWAPGNLLGYPAGTLVSEAELIYCELIPGMCMEQAPQPTYVWAPGNLLGYPAGTPVSEAELIYCELIPGMCTLVEPEGGEQRLVAVHANSPNLSVLRTGTGDLDVLASGDFDMRSPYGVYTAGTQTSLGDAALDTRYDQPRAKVQGGNVLGNNAGDHEALVNGDNSLYHAWYPNFGGNLLVSVGGDLTGDAWGAGGNSLSVGILDRASTSVGNWLWRQGTGVNSDFGDQPTAWWINFGTYTYDPYSSTSGIGFVDGGIKPAQQGFTGIGTLGGGNATVLVGGDAGIITARTTDSATTTRRSQGVILAVGSSGRVLDDGGLVLTGGGDLDVRIGGGWNAYADARQLNTNNTVAQTHDLYGGLVNLRGAITMTAGQIGTMELIYGGNATERDAREVRATDPYGSSMTLATGGLMLVPGDATTTIASRGDLVLGGVGDAGRVHTGNFLAFDGQGANEGGVAWFTLWSSATAINALSVGGNLALDTRAGESISANNPNWDYRATDGFFMLPGNLVAVAADGGIYYGRSATYRTVTSPNTTTLLLAPQGDRNLELLAGDSIYGGGYAISQSGAEESAMATIFQPGYAVYGGTGQTASLRRTNTSVEGVRPTSAWQSPLLAFGMNTVGRTVANRESSEPAARVYARDGDIVGLRLGGVITFDYFGSAHNGQTWYLGAGPVAVQAGRDIVYAGTRADEGVQRLADVVDGSASAGIGPIFAGNLIVHGDESDVSVIAAGRDMRYANWQIVGPGTLEITTGRNLLQEDLANLVSLGPVLPGDSRPGASIVVQAGLGDTGADWSGFLDLYLDPANQADMTSGLPLADQPGKVAKTYEAELIEWLAERYGFEAGIDEAAVEEALVYFNALPAEQQRIFARQVYFAELREGGREYNDADGPRFGSYLRGRDAIAALFPSEDADGNPIAYGGNVLMYGGSGIHTNIGGDIQVLTPGGAQTYGVEGDAPPPTAGLITQGQGNIQLYSLDNILLGQSRIMTTFGGDILAWSAEGDINAGRGSKTTVGYTPPRRVYDDIGNVTLSPQVPRTGAGIATLNPIPEVPPGDVDLIAPLGTVDAGEAGIRVSGNINIAALQVLNADNIQVQGESTGLPVIASVNVSALTSASAAANSAVQAAQDMVKKQTQQARPSVIQVQVLGFGDRTSHIENRRAPSGQQHASYDPGSAFQLLGGGELSQEQAARLTENERRNLGRY